MTDKPARRSTATRRLFEVSLTKGDFGVDDSVLVVGASDFERDLFAGFGFKDVCYSTPEDTPPVLAQSLPYPDGSFDLVFTEAVLHHLDRPHAAIYEMVRVSRRSVVIAESQDNFLARTLMRLGLMEQYELSAVKAHDGRAGGVNNSALPNFIYRWSAGEVEKSLRSLDAAHEPWLRCEYAWEPYQHGGRLGKLASAAGDALWRQGGNTFALHYDKTRGRPHPWISSDEVY